MAPPSSSGYNEGVFNAFAPGTGKGAMTGHIAGRTPLGLSLSDQAR